MDNLKISPKRATHKVELICPICNKKFFVSRYRIEKINKITCSYVCAGKLRTPAIIEKFSLNQDIVSEMQRLYENTSEKLYVIAEKLNIHRGTVIRYNKKNKWKRKKRPSSLREIYRKNASIKIGRELVKYEQVHHIDLNTQNNELSNLHVYKDAKDHTIAH